MPFYYFKQHRKETAVKKHLSKFNSVLEEKQKKAIIGSLFYLANGDREYHNKEHEFIKQASDLLGYNLSDSEHLIAEELMGMGKKTIFEELNTLTQEQKDWYVITALGMIHSDGKALDEEFKMLKDFLTQIYINHEHFEEVIRQTKLFKETTS